MKFPLVFNKVSSSIQSVYPIKVSTETSNSGEKYTLNRIGVVLKEDFKFDDRHDSFFKFKEDGEAMHYGFTQRPQGFVDYIYRDSSGKAWTGNLKTINSLLGEQYTLVEVLLKKENRFTNILLRDLVYYLETSSDYSLVEHSTGNTYLVHKSELPIVANAGYKYLDIELVFKTDIINIDKVYYAQRVGENSSGRLERFAKTLEEYKDCITNAEGNIQKLDYFNYCFSNGVEVASKPLLSVDNILAIQEVSFGNVIPTSRIVSLLARGWALIYDNKLVTPIDILTSPDIDKENVVVVDRSEKVKYYEQSLIGLDASFGILNFTLSVYDYKNVINPLYDNILQVCQSDLDRALVRAVDFK